MSRLGVSILLCSSLLGCGPKGGAKSPLAPGAPSLEKAPDYGKVDMIGYQDGELKPDGTNDLVFITKVEGPVSALFLALVDDKDAPTGEYQADTLVGNTESPPELGSKAGMVTHGLGVAEGGKLVNMPDGSLTAIGPGSHTLTLYIAPQPKLTPGSRVRVYAQRPDKAFIAGGTAVN